MAESTFSSGPGRWGARESTDRGQVKTGQAGVDEYRVIFGLNNLTNADQGLLVAWGGFKGNVRREARPQHFSMVLWDADDTLDALFAVYDELREDVRTRLPLKRTWTLVLGPE